jgi:integrase
MAHIQKRCTGCRRTFGGKSRRCPACGGEPAYVARYRAPGGQERSKSFARAIDAERYLDVQGSRKLRGEWIPPELGEETLDSYYGRWKDRALAVGKPSERTLIAYDQVWRQYVSGALGPRALGSITRADAQAVVDLAASPWRALDVRKVLSKIVGEAVKDDLIARNPAAALSVPRLEQDEPTVLTMAQVERLTEAIDDRYRARVLLGAYSALRWSELVGLTAENVDFLRRRVRVDRKIVESGKLIVGEPKTKGSRRWVSIPESVTLVLAEHVRLFPPGADWLLFPGPAGGPLRRKTFRRAWVKATATAGVPGFRVRNLRHTGATWALESGINPVLVAFRLGHSTTRMVEQHYGRLMESMDSDIARRLDDAREETGRNAGPLRDDGGTVGFGATGRRDE